MIRRAYIILSVLAVTASLAAQPLWAAQLEGFRIKPKEDGQVQVILETDHPQNYKVEQDAQGKVNIVLPNASLPDAFSDTGLPEFNDASSGVTAKVERVNNDLKLVLTQKQGKKVSYNVAVNNASAIPAPKAPVDMLKPDKAKINELFSQLKGSMGVPQTATRPARQSTIQPTARRPVPHIATRPHAPRVTVKPAVQPKPVAIVHPVHHPAPVAVKPAVAKPIAAKPAPKQAAKPVAEKPAPAAKPVAVHPVHTPVQSAQPAPVTTPKAINKPEKILIEPESVATNAPSNHPIVEEAPAQTKPEAQTTEPAPATEGGYGYLEQAEQQESPFAQKGMAPEEQAHPKQAPATKYHYAWFTPSMLKWGLLLLGVLAIILVMALVLAVWVKRRLAQQTSIGEEDFFDHTPAPLDDETFEAMEPEYPLSPQPEYEQPASFRDHLYGPPEEPTPVVEQPRPTAATTPPPPVAEKSLPKKEPAVATSSRPESRAPETMTHTSDLLYTPRSIRDAVKNSLGSKKSPYMSSPFKPGDKPNSQTAGGPQLKPRNNLANRA